MTEPGIPIRTLPLSSLRRRLLFLICLTTLPAALFTFFLAANERGAILARLEREALQLARLTSHEHAHQILGARKLLRWLGSKMAPHDLSSPTVSDPDFLRALLAGHPQLANIGVLSPDGEVRASAYALPSYRSWHDQPVFVAALRSQDVVTGTYAISPIFEQPTLNHAYAVRDSAGQVTSVLFNGLNLSWLSEMARQSDLPETFSLVIVDQQGQVLAAHWSAADTSLGDRTRIGGVADLARAGHGRLVHLAGTSAWRYFVAAPLAEAPGVFVAVGLPYEQMARQANRAFYGQLASLSVLTLFTIAAVFLATELGLLRTLRGLVRTVRQFGAGQLDARAALPRGRNELSTLAQAFNTMADSLAERHRQSLEAQEELRALAGRLHIAREREAARISRELHDEIGQLLTSLKIELARLTAHCTPGPSTSLCRQQLQADVGTINARLDTALDFVRRISAELRPGVLDRLGLVAALEWQARELEARSPLVVQVEADPLDQALPEIVTTTLFRITQEALTNVLRHAHARMVEIQLQARASDIVLEIRDDGVGATPQALDRSDALGIIGMRERAVLINGRLDIHGTPGRSTTVRVTVPARADLEADHAHLAGG